MIEEQRPIIDFPFTKAIWVVFNSTFAYLSGFVFWLLFYPLLHFLLGKYHSGEYIYYFTRTIILHEADGGWTQTTVFLGYFLPVALFVVGIILFYLWLKSLSRSPSIVRLFVFWFYLCGWALFFAYLSRGAIVERGDFGTVLAWMYLPDVLNKIFALLCIFSAALLGFFMRDFLLKLCPSDDFDVNTYQRRFILIVAFVPWFLVLIFNYALSEKVSFSDMNYFFQFFILLILLGSMIETRRREQRKIKLVKGFQSGRFNFLSFFTGLGFMVLVILIHFFGIRI